MKYIIRLGLYFAGLFILALGINLTVKSNLGVSPVSAFPLSISNIIGVSLGTVTIVVYAVFVLVQVLILRRDFRLISLLQICFSFVFGFFVDFTGILLTWVKPSDYLTQIVVMILGIITVSAGVVVYIAMDMVPNAPEGLILAICDKTGTSFSKMKVLFDITSVILAVGSSLVFLGNISTVREGTIISALLTGKIVGIISKPCTPLLKKVAFYDEENLSYNRELTQDVTA
jgi:uncharacterized membrane protein YczE